MYVILTIENDTAAAIKSGTPTSPTTIVLTDFNLRLSGVSEQQSAFEEICKCIRQTSSTEVVVMGASSHHDLLVEQLASSCPRDWRFSSILSISALLSGPASPLALVAKPGSTIIAQFDFASFVAAIWIANAGSKSFRQTALQILVSWWARNYDVDRLPNRLWRLTRQVFERNGQHRLLTADSRHDVQEELRLILRADRACADAEAAVEKSTLAEIARHPT